MYAGRNLTAYTGLVMAMPDVLETFRLETLKKHAQEPKYVVLGMPL